MRALINGDLVDLIHGDAGDMEVPSAFTGVPTAALRHVDGLIIDVRENTSWFVDERGRKRLAQDEGATRQPIDCAWDARLVKDAESWREESEEERAARNWEPVRAERDRRLAATDWTQLPDAPLAAASRKAWAAYRQALRDIPHSIDDPADVVWPDAPEG